MPCPLAGPPRNPDEARLSLGVGSVVFFLGPERRRADAGIATASCRRRITLPLDRGPQGVVESARPFVRLPVRASGSRGRGVEARSPRSSSVPLREGRRRRRPVELGGRTVRRHGGQRALARAAGGGACRVGLTDAPDDVGPAFQDTTVSPQLSLDSPFPPPPGMPARRTGLRPSGERAGIPRSGQAATRHGDPLGYVPVGGASRT